MAVNLSALAGAGQQFFDNNGNPLSGGKLWSYQAGTTTPQTTYTTAAGNVAHTNPIILDSAGRVSTGEIWLTAGSNYKFVLMTSTDVTLATWDNITGINGTGITSNAVNVSYDPPFTGGVQTNVEAKLAQTVSVKDFGADPTGVADSTAAIVTALATGKDVMLSDGTYKLSPSAVQTIANQGYQRLYGEGNATLSVNLASSIDLFVFNGPVALENLTIDFNNSYCKYAFRWVNSVGHVRLSNLRVRNLKDIDSTTGSITFFISPTGNTFEIDGVKASSMLKRGNGNITDAEGSYSFIYVGGTGPTQGSINDVFVSEIHNIDASDQIIYEDTAGIYVLTTSNDQNNCIGISNIQGYNFGKRLLKIHASNVSITNVTGYSPEGDSLGVIGFNNGQGLGDKYGCVVNGARAYGLMEYAFASDAPNTTWRNITASVQPGNKPGMSNGAVALLISNDNALVDGFWSDSQRNIAIGSSQRVVQNTTLRNIHQVLTNTSSSGTSIYLTSDTTGFDGLIIDGATAQVAANATNAYASINLSTYLNGTTKKGRNVDIRNYVVNTNGPVNHYGAVISYCENVSISGTKYINTSGNLHLRVFDIASCANVNIDDVEIEGTNQIGVFIKDCTGQTSIGRVYNPNASIAAVYNNNSTNVWVYGCDQTKVSGVTTATPQNSKQTSGTTANRPTTGLVAGYSQHFDTTLGKPIWWNGSVWKDANGVTV